MGHLTARSEVKGQSRRFRRLIRVQLTEDQGMVDDAKLHQFVEQMLSDLGGAARIALVRIDERRFR
jgi:hypothetical protein